MIDKTISIIIPSYKRSAKLKKCIQSILAQNIPKNEYEIIVIDDCSNGNDIINILKKIEYNECNFKYRILSEQRGPASARNLGIKIASGNILVFTDNDCELDKNYFRNILRLHKKNANYDIIGGYTYTNRFNLKSNIVQFMINSAVFNKINGKKKIVFFPTCNVSLKKDVFNSEKFNENFKFPGGEDLEFFWRLFKKKYKFLYDKSIKVFHNTNLSFISFLGYPFIYGKENLYVKKMHKNHPALQDLDDSCIIGYSYCFLKEIVRSPFLAISLANKFKSDKNTNIKMLDYFLSLFYFFLFRLTYLSGFLLEFTRVSLKTNYEKT